MTIKYMTPLCWAMLCNRAFGVTHGFKTARLCKCKSFIILISLLLASKYPEREESKINVEIWEYLAIVLNYISLTEALPLAKNVQ